MIKIGTCGFGYYDPGPNWKERFRSKLEAFADLFPLCEINSTFYGLPAVKTSERWRREAGQKLELSLKAWQAVTHLTSSPTWRRGIEKLTERQRASFGHLRPNEEVFDAWRATRECAIALGAKVCVVQTPPSFGYLPEHEADLRQFFGTADRGELRVAWECRGTWLDHPDAVGRLCDDLGLIHVVDLLRRDPASAGPIAYVRLHGLNPSEFDFRYTYSEDELRQIAVKLLKLEDRHEVVYCLFNNTAMYANALRLVEIMR